MARVPDVFESRYGRQGGLQRIATFPEGVIAGMERGIGQIANHFAIKAKVNKQRLECTGHCLRQSAESDGSTVLRSIEFGQKSVR
jgi:hypothetical protein